MIKKCNVVLLVLIPLCLRAAVLANFTDYYCWPGNAIPYLMAHEFTGDQKLQILTKISVFHKRTCLRWVDITESIPAPDAVEDLLSFEKVPGDRCSLSVKGFAAAGGTKVWVSVQLSDFCFTERLVMHMMMQALGFRNEHQRYDRNCYVEVSRFVSNSSSFQIQSREPWLENYPYDLRSVMHYRHSSELNSRRNLLDPLGSLDDSLTTLDLSKVQFKFCGGPHICDEKPEICQKAESYKKGIRCYPKRSAPLGLIT